MSSVLGAMATAATLLTGVPGLAQPLDCEDPVGEWWALCFDAMGLSYAFGNAEGFAAFCGAAEEEAFFGDCGRGYVERLRMPEVATPATAELAQKLYEEGVAQGRRGDVRSEGATCEDLALAVEGDLGRLCTLPELPQ